MIDDKYIEECLAEKNGKKRIKPMRWAVAAVLIVGILFSVSYKVNAQFHQWVISIINIETKDEIRNEQSFSNQIKNENDTNVIQVSEVKNLDDMIQKQYVTAQYYVEAYEDIYISCHDNKENYFYIKNNKFVPISKVKQITRTISWNNCIGHIQANIISYNGKQYVRNLDGAFNDFYRFELSIDDQNDYWMMMSINSNADSYSYPLKYNVNKGKITDALRNVKIKKKSLRKYKIVTNWEKISNKYWSVLVGDSINEARYYLIDATKQTAMSVEKLTNTKDIQFIRGVEQYIVVGTKALDTEEDVFDCYCYNLDTGEWKIIYQRVKIWDDNYVDMNEVNPRVAFSGGRYDLMIQKQVIYLVDEITGEKNKIEGLDPGVVSGDVLINGKGDKLLINTDFSEEGIKQVGILDINLKKIYMFNRENSSSYKEFSIGWQNDCTIVIQASDDYDRSAVYLYGLK